VKVTELPDTGGRMPDAAGARIVMLDETGETPGSVAFSQRLGRWRDEACVNVVS